MPPHSARYSPEFRESAVRMVAKVRPKYSSESAAISAVASELGIANPETLRRWVRQSESSSSASQKSTGFSNWNSLKRPLRRPHPIVIGVIATVVGGLILTYFQLVLGSSNHHPALEVDQVGLSPGGVVFPQNSPLPMVTPFKIDIKLLNTGTQLAAINDARLVIQQFVKIPQCATQGGFGSTGSYTSNMPTDPRPGTAVTIPVSQLVNPDGADRFDLLLRAPTSQNGLVTIYLYRVHVYLDYNTGASPTDVGEVLIDLPYDPLNGDAYFWTHFFANHPDYFNFDGKYAFGIERCLIRNSKLLNSILSLPAQRTAKVSVIPPQLAFCCARREGS
jgi:transposase-like protein